MKKVVALLLALGLSPSLLLGATFPPYENTVRAWGAVVELYPSGGHIVAFTVKVPGGAQVRLDCGSDLTLNCDAVARGDSILAVGHLVDRLSCHTDGIDDLTQVNVLWKCTPACVQITP